MLMITRLAICLLVLCLTAITNGTSLFNYDESDTDADLFDSYSKVDERMNQLLSSFVQNERRELFEDAHPSGRISPYPFESLRSKRFWLFAKKDDDVINADATSNANSKHNPLPQGLWRSGIVGRRR